MLLTPEWTWRNVADPLLVVAALESRLMTRVTVVGIGADGWAGLPLRVRERIGAAEVVLGGARHLALLPDLPDQPGQPDQTGQPDLPEQVRRPWPSPLRAGLPALLEEYSDRDIVVLASGDPLVSGIGATLIDLLGADRVRIEPAVSSVGLARARMGWPAETMAEVTVVGRDPRRVLREVAPGARVIVLSSDEQTPREIGRLLTEAGWGESRLTVLGELGAPNESRADLSARQCADAVVGLPRLNIVAIACAPAPDTDAPAWGRAVGSRASGLPDDAFEHDGQLTKRDLRASALARLAPQPGQTLWDVGAGAGSVGIEWMRAHQNCRTVAIESDPERAVRITHNAGRLGVPDLRVVEGRAPDALVDLPRPDAVFIGGGASRPGVLDTCLKALAPGGRLVVHAVTLETEAALVARRAELGGELTRLAVDTALPLASYTSWTPARPVVQWAWTKPVT